MWDTHWNMFFYKFMLLLITKWIKSATVNCFQINGVHGGFFRNVYVYFTAIYIPLMLKYWHLHFENIFGVKWFPEAFCFNLIKINQPLTFLPKIEIRLLTYDLIKIKIFIAKQILFILWLYVLLVKVKCSLALSIQPNEDTSFSRILSLVFIFV